MANQTYTYSVPAPYHGQLRQYLQEHGLPPDQQAQAGTGTSILWRLRRPGCTAVMYKSGKLVLQGASADEAGRLVESFSQNLSRPPALGSGADRKPGGSCNEEGAPHGQPPPIKMIKKADHRTKRVEAQISPAPGAGLVEQCYGPALARHPAPISDPWCGSDETGKGDYFGPLVVAAAAIPRDRLETVALLGVKDSKQFKDKVISQLAPQLMELLPNRVVSIGPSRYNSLRPSMRNLNTMLAWAHARALEDLLSQPEVEKCTYVLSDQFGNRSHLERALMERGQRVRLEQRPRAEEDPAVACASIIARYHFIRAMDSLGKRVGQELPKGAGPRVVETARQLAQKHGQEVLREVAKLHFATTVQAIGHPMAE